MVIAVLLALTTPAGDCKPIDPGASFDNPEPLQRAGDGLWIGGLAFTPADIGSAQAVNDTTGEQWVLDLRFTPAGRTKFIEAQRCGVGHPMEISVDRVVVSRPVLNEKIAGDQARVSANWQNRAEVEAMARRITGS
jgi:preprotein translocase subunit SecD